MDDHHLFQNVNTCTLLYSDCPRKKLHYRLYYSNAEIKVIRVGYPSIYTGPGEDTDTYLVQYSKAQIQVTRVGYPSIYRGPKEDTDTYLV
jgi:hypothetical protein